MPQDRTAAGLVDEAMERAGLALGSVPQSALDAARRSLSLLLSDLPNDGFSVPWLMVDAIMTAGSGQAEIAVPENYHRVEHVARVEGPTRLPLKSMGQNTWDNLPNRNQLGRPTAWHLRRTPANDFIALWPVPSGDVTLAVRAVRHAADALDLAADVEIPGRWREAITAELAKRIAMKLAPDRYAMLGEDAARAWSRARKGEKRPVPTTFGAHLSRYRN